MAGTFHPSSYYRRQACYSVTAGLEAALVAGLVQRVAGGDAPEKEESEDATWAGG